MVTTKKCAVCGLSQVLLNYRKSGTSRDGYARRCKECDVNRLIERHQKSDIVGKRFGRLIVIAPVRIQKYSGWGWLCKCDCGSDSIKRPDCLKSGKVLSCGCLISILLSSNMRRHGASRTSLYWTWSQMRQRCENPRNGAYADYGGRGIKVCDRWQSYESFAEDMGARPDGMSLDRIDPNGPYSPENCRWATKKTQTDNRRNTKLIEYNGVSRSIREWSKISGICRETIRKKLKDGFSMSEIMDSKQACGLVSVSKAVAA